MSNIFLTGMSAPQASPTANSRSLSFAGVLHKVLVAAGHDVVWASPSVYMTAESLSKFDAVIVGVTPMTSVGANRVYGALHVINTLWGSDKLTMFVDSPNNSQIQVSLNALISEPNNLTKPFYSYRKEYSNVAADADLRNNIMNGVRLLNDEEWGNTIYPYLPWKTFDAVKLNANAKRNLHGINLDSHLLLEEPLEVDRKNKWVVDNYNSPWVKSTISTLSLPNFPMKWNKGWTDVEVEEQISRAIGSIIAPNKKDGTWWTYRYIQSMNSRTPIATDWKESSHIGEAWSVLASSLESMSESKREMIGLAQYESYVSNIPSRKDSLKNLEKRLSI